MNSKTDSIQNYIFIYIFLIFFPFPFKISFIYNSEIFLKDLLFFILACHLLFKFKKIYGKNDHLHIKKIIFISFSIVLIVHFFSLVNYITYESEYENIELFINNYLRSLMLSISFITFFLFFVKKLDIKIIRSIFKIYSFICLFICFEFFFSIILKNLLNLEIFYKIYPPDIFRSLLVNGHIATTIHLCIGFFISLNLFAIYKEKIFAFISILLLIPILYNIETRLTILAFIYTILICFLNKKKNSGFKTIIYSNIVYLIFIVISLYFIIKDGYNFYYSISDFKIQADSLLDRFNSSVAFFVTFINFPIGMGFENAGSFLSLNKLTPLIYFGDTENLSALVTYYNLYPDSHGIFAKPHGYLINFLTSYGIFTFPIVLIFKNLYKYNENKNNYTFYTSIMIIFFSTASMFNYTYEIEYLFIFILGAYFKLINLENKK